MKWIVVQTKPNCENKAYLNLKRQGYEIFFPKVKKTISKFNKFINVVKPLFPSYIFVSITSKQNWSKIRNTYGVSKILKFSDHLYFLPFDVINDLKMKCDCRGFAVDFRKYVKGEKVRFFKNNQTCLDAVFEEQIDKKRSFIFINFLNQKVKASVETKNLEVLV